MLLATVDYFIFENKVKSIFDRQHRGDPREVVMAGGHGENLCHSDRAVFGGNVSGGPDVQTGEELSPLAGEPSVWKWCRDELKPNW